MCVCVCVCVLTGAVPAAKRTPSGKGDWEVRGDLQPHLRAGSAGAERRAKGQQVSYDVDAHNDISEQNIVQGHGSP